MLQSYTCLSVHKLNGQTWALRHNTNIITPTCPEGDTDRDPGFPAPEILEDHLSAGRNSIHSLFSSPYSVMDWQDEAEGVGGPLSLATSNKPPTRRMLVAFCQIHKLWVNISSVSSSSLQYLLGPFHPIRHFPRGQWVPALTHQKWKGLHKLNVCTVWVCVLWWYSQRRVPPWGLKE